MEEREFSENEKVDMPEPRTEFNEEKKLDRVDLELSGLGEREADDTTKDEPQIEPTGPPEEKLEEKMEAGNPRFKNSFNEVVNLPTLVFDRHTTKLSVKVNLPSFIILRQITG